MVSLGVHARVMEKDLPSFVISSEKNIANLRELKETGQRSRAGNSQIS